MTSLPHCSARRAFIHLLLAPLVIGGLLQAQTKPASVLPAATPSAFEQSTDGWIALVSRSDLSEWKRERYPASKPMGESNPWSYDASSGVISCHASGIHEMLLHRRVQGNGIFHLQFRFVGNSPKPNSGVFVRTLPDASSWYQAQLAPSGLGVVFGQNGMSEGKPKRISAGARYPELLRPAGEWNTVEITCQGSQLILWINGHVTARTDALATLKGHVGLEAEFNSIEFRNLRFKPLP